MNENIETQVEKLSPFTRFCMTIGQLPSSYLMSMSYLEQLTWLCNYLKETIIPVVNNNADAVEEIQRLYLELQNYVDNYFDNLDVQAQINYKLDQMAQDGTLTALIKNYIDPYIDIQNNAISNIREDVDEISNKVDSVASGSPAGVYATVSDLTTADPDHNKIYLVTADGKWYYYDTNQWTAGGTYQTTGMSEGDIEPYLTSFYENSNLYPKQNYVTGKVLYVTDGSEVAWPTGSYNPEYIEVDYTKIYVVINSTKLVYSEPTFYTYDEDKVFLGYERPSSDTRKLVTFDSDVKYIRVGFWNINTPTLTAKTLFMTLDDALKLLSYEKFYTIKNEDFNAIKTDDIIIPNEYGFQLAPYQIVAAGNPYSTLEFPTIYEMKSTNVSANGGNFIGIAFDYDTSKLEAGDKIYIDTTGSSTIGSVSLFCTSSTSQNIITGVSEGNGIYSITLDAVNLAAMNSAKGVNGYYPRIVVIRQGQSAGVTLTTNMRCWINEDFTNLTLYLENVMSILNTYNEKKTLKVLVLGDSITALTSDRSWLTYFNQIQPINVIQNVAVSGAHLKDYSDSVYDGNPVYNGPDNNHNNVLGNQVQKIINNSYQAPDIIMIAIGTNDGINCSEQDIYNSYYDSNGNLIDLENVDRQTTAGAFRYCNETLRTLYPNATIFWCSPIQGYNSIRNLNNIITYGKNLKNLCEYSSTQFIDTQDCGITGYTEYNGSNGLYLIDGLHPNSNGAKYMGYYNATKVQEYCESAKLLNE